MILSRYVPSYAHLIWDESAFLDLGKQWVQDLSPGTLNAERTWKGEMLTAFGQGHELGHELCEGRERPSAHLCIQPVCDTANTCLLS